MEKAAKDLKAGDTTPWYRILKVRKEGDKIVADIRHNDGGTDTRMWDNPDTMVTVIKT